MSTFLLEPGIAGRWDLVELDRPHRPLISGWLHLDRPVAVSVDLTARPTSTENRNTQ